MLDNIIDMYISQTYAVYHQQSGKRKSSIKIQQNLFPLERETIYQGSRTYSSTTFSCKAQETSFRQFYAALGSNNIQAGIKTLPDGKALNYFIRKENDAGCEKGAIPSKTQTLIKAIHNGLQ